MTALDPATPATEGPNQAQNRFVVACVALFAGAIAMGVSPVFVRFAAVDPFVSAFWRVTMALPLLWIWARIENSGRGRRAVPLMRRFSPLVVLAGVLFAGDLVFWHLSIHHTTIANATLLATLSPVWVVLGSRFLIRETVARGTVAGLALCIAGAALLVGAGFQVHPGRLVGDLYGVVTSLFFGSYVLVVRVLRKSMGAGEMMFLSSVVTAAVLLVVALAGGGPMWPPTLAGVASLVSIAVFSHVGGQGLTAFALGHLPAAFSSLVIFVEALAAAITGYFVFGEDMTPLQMAGAATLILGIWIARPRRAAAAG